MSEQQLECFVFSGPPGSGKGTVAQQCVQNLGWLQLSTGDLCRKHIAEGTEIGKQIDFAIKSGKLVDDALIIDMVAQWIQEHKNSGKTIIFDGFPRTVVQAQLFIQLIEKKLTWIKLVVIDFKIDDAVVIQRLSSRRICSNKQCQAVYSVASGSQKRPMIEGKCDFCGASLIQRLDDVSATVEKRLQVYHQHADLVLDFYKQSGVKINSINADQPIDIAFKAVVAVKELQ